MHYFLPRNRLLFLTGPQAAVHVQEHGDGCRGPGAEAEDAELAGFSVE